MYAVYISICAYVWLTEHMLSSWMHDTTDISSVYGNVEEWAQTLLTITSYTQNTYVYLDNNYNNNNGAKREPKFPK